MTGLEVVGVDVFDAGFMTVVNIATAAHAGGSAAARAAGKSALREVGELITERGGRQSIPDVAEEGFSRYLSNSTAPEVRQALASRTAEIRNSLPDALQQKGNISNANVAIAKFSAEMRAFSRYADGKSGFVPKPKGDTVLRPLSVGGWGVVEGKGHFLRDVDGEFKILEDVARTLREDRAATGRIDLFTELKACTSCLGAIMQFGGRYPGIQLNIFTGKWAWGSGVTWIILAP